MNINELFENLAKHNINPTAKDICKIWDMDEASFSRKKKAGTEIKHKNIIQLENELDIKLIKNDTTELKYNTVDLKKVIITLENYISETGISISSDKKADIIILLYQLYAKNHDLSDDIISQMCEIAK